jgi:hypothetical protein
MNEIVEIQQEEALFGMDRYDPTCYAVEILDTKYEKVEVDEVINQLNHLNTEQEEDLRKVLKEHTKLFDGTKFHIDLVPGAVSKHARPYPVPMIHLNAFKKDLLYLAKIGILSLQSASEWASPMFITPKKKMAESIGLVIYGNSIPTTYHMGYFTTMQRIRIPY